MLHYDEDELSEADEPSRPRPPVRKSSGPGRERKQKARRASNRKQGNSASAGIHRRGSKRRTK
ncbi:MAG: hypothetical protein AAF266_02430 [Planctomycetota bacterium]